MGHSSGIDDAHFQRVQADEGGGRLKACIIRRAAYKLPGSKRLVWGAVLCERGGLSLLFVKKPDDKWEHEIVVATESPKQHCFELADANRFAVEPEDLEEIAAKVAALGESISGNDWMKFFKDEDLW